MNPNCPICRGIGWVCENHPEKPWDPELGCICGAGAPCKCNATGGVDEPDVIQVIVDDEPKRRHSCMLASHIATPPTTKDRALKRLEIGLAEF